MKKRVEKTEEQRERNIRFIRKGPVKSKKYERLMKGRMTKEDLVDSLSVLIANIAKLTVTVKVIDVYKQAISEKEVRKYKHVPSYGSFHRLNRKILTGIYGSTLEVARKEGVV